MEDCLASSIRIIGKTCAGRDVIQRSVYSTDRHPRVTGEEHADRSQLQSGLAHDRNVRECMRLRAGREVRLHVLRIGGRLLPIVAEAKIEGQVRADTPVVLCEETIAVPVCIRIQAGVLPHAGWNAREKVRQGVSGARAAGTVGGREAKRTVVRERGKLEVFLHACFAAEIQ